MILMHESNFKNTSLWIYNFQKIEECKSFKHSNALPSYFHIFMTNPHLMMKIIKYIDIRMIFMHSLKC